MAVCQQKYQQKDWLLRRIVACRETKKNPLPLEEGGFWGVLPLNMLDVCEENARQAPGAWADEPTREQHFKYCEIPDNCAPSLSHAHAIRDFVCQLHECEDELELVVHCSAGVSRSAAVAWWASERFGASLRDSASVGLGEANPRILRLLKSLV